MKIRLGNDIRLKVQLPNNPVTGQRYNIISARAFFVNATLEEDIQKKYIKKNRFIGRFPIEPFVDEFEPTAYNINCSGNPKYRAFVCNQYNGFGVKPNWKECMPVKDVNITRYESQVDQTVNSNEIVVTFPASAQLYAGKYILIIVATIFDAGYSNNGRTITTDMQNVFELVNTSAEEQNIDHPVFIEIDNTSDEQSNDIYVVSGSYNDDNVILTRSDNSHVNIDLSPITGWYEEQ